MSMNNGVYILATKDGQYRVKHIKGVEWLYDVDELCAENVIKEYADVKCTMNRDTAIRIADKILRGLPMCEFGINYIKCNDKTWNQILKEGGNQS